MCRRCRQNVDTFPNRCHLYGDKRNECIEIVSRRAECPFYFNITQNFLYSMFLKSIDQWKNMCTVLGTEIMKTFLCAYALFKSENSHYDIKIRCTREFWIILELCNLWLKYRGWKMIKTSVIFFYSSQMLILNSNKTMV